MAVALVGAIGGPVAAARPGPRIVGGGDDPAIREVQSAEDLAVGRWKRSEIGRLRDLATRQAATSASCGPDCIPSSFSVNAYPRTQINGYYCGVATAQEIINLTRSIFSTSLDGNATATNYVTQSRLGAEMGTDADSGSSSWMVRDGLNAHADLDVAGRQVRFTVLENISSGSDFHWTMITAIYEFLRGAGVPIQMTYSSQHLASWSSQVWWSTRKGHVVRHWIMIRAYAGFWDGTYAPMLTYNDSAGGFGGASGAFSDASRVIYNLNQANSKRLVF